MQAFDMVHGQLQRYSDMYAADLAHLSNDHLHQVPMGAARTIASFTAEVAGFNRLVAAILRGEPASMPDPETVDAFVQSIDSIGKAQELVKSSANEICEALASVGAEAAQAEVLAPWGEPTTKINLASMAASHMMYHDGQINYIQSLHGDAVNHWFED